MLPRIFVFALPAVAVAIFTACGGDDDAPGPASSTLNLTPEMQALLAMPGFTEFAGAFNRAVSDNDTDFFRTRAYYEDYSGCDDGSVATPVFGSCNTIGAAPEGAGIVYGAWNSEGDVVDPDGYAAAIEQTLSLENAENAETSVIGLAVRHEGAPETGADIVIAHAGRVTPSGELPPVDAALSVQVDLIDNNWRIVSISRASTLLVDDFYEWYLPFVVALDGNN